MVLMQLCQRIFKFKKKKQPKEDDPIAYRYYVNLNTSPQTNKFWNQLESWFPENIIQIGSGFVEIPFQSYREVENMMRRARIHFKRLNPIYSSPVKELLESRKATVMYWCVISSTAMTFITTLLFIIRFIMAFL